MADNNHGQISKLVTGVKRVIMIRLHDGDDLITIMREVARREGIRAGFFTALGAMTKVCFSAYSLEKGRYEDITMEGYFEFTSIVGNISTVIDDKGSEVDLFVHAHVNFAGHDGRAYGGHLQTGMSCVALGEITICELDKPMFRLQRELSMKGCSPLRFSLEE